MLELEVKELIIEVLQLEDITPDDIDSAAPLFVEAPGPRAEACSGGGVPTVWQPFSPAAVAGGQGPAAATSSGLEGRSEDGAPAPGAIAAAAGRVGAFCGGAARCGCSLRFAAVDMSRLPPYCTSISQSS